MIAPPRIQTRPAQIAKATGLLCLSLAIRSVNLIIYWRSRDFPLIMTFIFAVNVLIIWKIWQGRNWARTTLWVLFVISLMGTANALLSSFRLSRVQAIVTTVQLVMWVCALSLVYGSKAEGWFQSKKTQVL